MVFNEQAELVSSLSCLNLRKIPPKVLAIPLSALYTKTINFKYLMCSSVPSEHSMHQQIARVKTRVTCETHTQSAQRGCLYRMSTNNTCLPNAVPSCKTYWNN